MLDPAATNRSTPRDMTRLLGAIWWDEACAPEYAASMRRLLGLQVWPHRLASGFPFDDVHVVGKTGSLPTVRNEVGVVEYPDGGRYAVAVFTRASSPAAVLPPGRRRLRHDRPPSGRRPPHPHDLTRRPRRRAPRRRPDFGAGKHPLAGDGVLNRPVLRTVEKPGSARPALPPPRPSTGTPAALRASREQAPFPPSSEPFRRLDKGFGHTI